MYVVCCKKVKNHWFSLPVVFRFKKEVMNENLSPTHL